MPGSLTPEQEIVVSLAGAAAERLYCGRGVPSRQDRDSALASALRISSTVPEQYLAAGEADAERLVAKHRGEISAVAEALFASPDGLTGDAIERILRRDDGILHRPATVARASGGDLDCLSFWCARPATMSYEDFWLTRASRL
jgi:hypothetical protein